MKVKGKVRRTKKAGTYEAREEMSVVLKSVRYCHKVLQWTNGGTARLRSTSNQRKTWSGAEESRTSDEGFSKSQGAK